MLTGLFGRTTLLAKDRSVSADAKRNIVVDEALRAARKRHRRLSLGSMHAGQARGAQAVQGFDERFFLYWEDADLCRRLRATAITSGRARRHRHPSRWPIEPDGARPAIRAFHERVSLTRGTSRRRRSIRNVPSRAILFARCRLQLLARHFDRPT